MAVTNRSRKFSKVLFFIGLLALLTPQTADAFLCLTVPANISVEPSSIDFGSVNVGSSSQSTFAVTFTCGGIIENAFCTHTCFGPSNATISITGIPSGFSVSPSSFNLADAASRSVQVTFRPTLEQGYSGNLTVNTTSGSSKTVSLTGVGHQPRPVIDIQPTSLDYGTVSVSGPFPANNVVVRNAGDANLTLRGMSVSGPFSILSSPSFPFTVTPGNQTTVTVRFVPTVRGSASGQLTILSANPDNPSINDTWLVNLSGGGRAPKLLLAPTSHDFGSVPVGNEDFKDFIFTNDCAPYPCTSEYVEALQVSNIVSNNSQFGPDRSSLNVPPGGDASVRIVFRPIVIGLYTWRVSFTTNAPSPPASSISLQGRGIAPAISLSSLALNHGQVRVGQTGNQQLIVSNTGSLPLSVSFSSTSTAFSIVPSSGNISAGGSSNFTVFFSPTSEQTYVGQLNVTANDPAAPNLGIDLSGEGITPELDVSPTCPDTPAVGVCEPFDFGDVSIGDTRVRHFSIRNLGSASLNVQDITVSNGAFSVSPRVASIVPGGLQDITVSYRPTVIRSDNSTLTIISDDLNEGAKAIAVNARAVSDLDLFVRQLEVTQTIQTLDQSVPLVSGKKTVVRAYVGLTVVGGGERNITNVDGILRVFRNGVEITSGVGIRSGEIITAYPFSVDGSSGETLRSSIRRTLNFIVPPDMANGNLQFQVEVNPANGRVLRIDEWNYSNNTLSLNASFQARRRPEIAYIPINYTINDRGLPNETLMVTNTGQFKRMFPISDFDYLRRPPITFGLDVHWIEGGGGILNAGKLADAIFKAENLRTGNKPAEKVFGWLPSFGSSGFGWMLFPSMGRAGFATISYGDTIFPHELGHGYGFYHPNNYLACTQTDLDPLFPPDTGVEIFDTDFTVKARKKWADFMSYCSPKWIPLDKYLTLYDEFDPSRAPSNTGGGGSSPAFLMSGYITENGEASLFPVYEAEGTPEDLPPVDGSSNYTLRALDAGGTLIWEIPIEASFDNQGSEDLPDVPSVFSFVAPAPETVATFQVLRGETEILAERRRSDSPPSLEILKPDGTEDVGDVLHVKWESEDADGDPLLASVLISYDGGSTFDVIGANLKQDEFFYDPSQIRGGSNVSVRVMVTDGFNTVSADSPSFSIRSKPPSVVVLAPQDRETFGGGSMVILEAATADPEDGTLPDSSIHWSSDRSGSLGNGKMITVDNLALGEHVITVTATDSDGNSSSGSATIRVADVAVAPTAEAGEPQTVNEGDSMMLDGTESADPNPGDVLSYHWEQIAGPPALFGDEESSQPNLMLPQVSEDTSLRFVLTVSDQDGNSSTDTIDVMVLDVNFPLMTLSASEIDFGILGIGGTSSQALLIRNEGNETLTVREIKTSRPVFTISPTLLDVQPGSSSQITVAFRPNDLEVVSNTKAGVPVTVVLRGNTPQGQIVHDDNSAGGSLLPANFVPPPSDSSGTDLGIPSSPSPSESGESDQGGTPEPDEAANPEPQGTDPGSFGFVGVGGCSLVGRSP